MMLELTLTAVVVVDTLEELAVEVRPFLESVALTEHAWRYAAGYQSSLNAERAAAAERIEQVAFSVPAAHHDDAGSQHFVKWCRHALLTVASAV